MKIVLPKESRGYVFDRLFSIEMNDFDIARLLPSLFYLAVTRGRQRAARTNDPEAFNLYIDRLLNHPRMVGFEGESGRRLLDRWVRSSVIHLGKVGRSQQQEQIEFILPLTLLAYKAGLPAEIRRQRNVHIFIYGILKSVLSDDANPAALLDHIFRNAFGQGLAIGDAPRYEGSYDGKTELDLHTLLSICYLDGFQATEASKREMLAAFDPALPAAAAMIGRHILQYIIAYHRRLPALSLTRGLMALINFELFIYTNKLIYAINSMVQNGVLPPLMQSRENQPGLEIYVDFTRHRGSISDNLARTCVERDLEELRAFYESTLLLRTIDRFLMQQPQMKDRYKSLSTPAYLENLIKLSANAEINADARAEIRAIKQETLNACLNDNEKAEAEQLFTELERLVQSNSVALNVKMLSEAQGKNAMHSMVTWFWATGGLRKPFGILAGNWQGRRNWRYAMSDDLLVTLVQLAMVDNNTDNLIDARVNPRIKMSDFLNFLESNFGIVLERPPAFLDSTETRAAAKENLEVMRRRLRQMGFFQALSDDFTAQYLRDPLQAGNAI
jgi:hypothetical protein